MAQQQQQKDLNSKLSTPKSIHSLTPAHSLINIIIIQYYTEKEVYRPSLPQDVEYTQPQITQTNIITSRWTR
jgi:hypothetical protein